jgi:hypothetical protein
MNDKAVEIINANQAVPKKTKIVQSKNQAPAEAGESAAGIKIEKTPKLRRTSTRRKASAPGAKESPVARKEKVSMPAAAENVATDPSDEAVRLRAYFISERRRRFALPGDVDSDWLEARRQLLSEAGPR